MIRLFAALALPDEIAAGLARRQDGVPGARWRPREALHVTLRFFGEVANDHVAHMAPLTGREWLVLSALAVPVILFGIWPQPLLHAMHASTEHLAQQLLMSKIAP